MKMKRNAMVGAIHEGVIADVDGKDIVEAVELKIRGGGILQIDSSMTFEIFCGGGNCNVKLMGKDEQTGTCTRKVTQNRYTTDFI